MFCFQFPSSLIFLLPPHTVLACIFTGRYMTVNLNAHISICRRTILHHAVNTTADHFSQISNHPTPQTNLQNTPLTTTTTPAGEKTIKVSIHTGTFSPYLQIYQTYLNTHFN